MPPLIASIVCVCGIAGLLYLDRDKSVRVSNALWLPGAWIALVGSRPLSLWLGLSQESKSQVDGSPLDAAVFGILIVIALGVLIVRRKRSFSLLLANWPLLVYFSYCLISITWAYYPDIAFKRWIKAVGDLAMVLVVATDPHPVIAIKRLASRLGMLLFPTSVLFIRYYGDLGRNYTADGMLMNTGVTTNKNTLGLIVLVISLVVLWNVRSLLVSKDTPHRTRRLIAQGTLLAFGVALFWMADSSTCKACFVLGGVLMGALNLRVIKGRPARAHALFAAVLVLAAAVYFSDSKADLAGALGRQSNMSGRTDLWAAVIPTVPNSLVGAGFESFWISPDVKAFQTTLLRAGWYPALVEDLNEAHNGYIEMYLNLGWIGVCLIAGVLVGGYLRACRAFRKDPELGSLLLTYVAIAAVYSITEAGFRIMNPCWIFLLLAVVTATTLTTTALAAKKLTTNAAPFGTSSRAAVSRRYANVRLESD